MDPVKKRMVFNYPDEIVYTGDMIEGPDERYKMTEDGSMFIEPLGQYINPALDPSFSEMMHQLRLTMEVTL